MNKWNEDIVADDDDDELIGLTMTMTMTMTMTGSRLKIAKSISYCWTLVADDELLLLLLLLLLLCGWRILLWRDGCGAMDAKTCCCWCYWNFKSVARTVRVQPSLSYFNLICYISLCCWSWVFPFLLSACCHPVGHPVVLPLQTIVFFFPVMDVVVYVNGVFYCCLWRCRDYEMTTMTRSQRHIHQRRYQNQRQCQCQPQRQRLSIKLLLVFVVTVTVAW